MNFGRQNVVYQKSHNARALCAPTLGCYRNALRYYEFKYQVACAEHVLELA